MIIRLLPLFECRPAMASHGVLKSPHSFQPPLIGSRSPRLSNHHQAKMRNSCLERLEMLRLDPPVEHLAGQVVFLGGSTEVELCSGWDISETMTYS